MDMPFAHFLSSLLNCTLLLGEKQRFTRTISGSVRRRYEGPNEGLNVSLKKYTFRDKNIEEICPFPQERRDVFYFNNETFYLEKEALLEYENFGRANALGPLIPGSPLTESLQRQ